MSAHKAEIRWKTRRMVMLSVLVEVDLIVKVKCSCGASMKRKMGMRREWKEKAVWRLAFAITDTEAKSKTGASRCPALLAVVRNTADAAGEPLSVKAARAVLRGEE